MDRFTRTRIPAQHPGLTCSRKRTLFASTVLAAVITVTAKEVAFAVVWNMYIIALIMKYIYRRDASKRFIVT